MKTFLEFLDTQNNHTALAARIVDSHAPAIRKLIKTALKEGLLDGDEILKKDLIELMEALKGNPTGSLPPNNQKPKEIDIVGRPIADGGGVQDNG